MSDCKEKGKHGYVVIRDLWLRYLRELLSFWDLLVDFFGEVLFGFERRVGHVDGKPNLEAMIMSVALAVQVAELRFRKAVSWAWVLRACFTQAAVPTRLE
jgi:hypothetical protein